MSFEKSIATNILIVGGGITGSVVASLIKNEAVVNIEIWEMDQIGGRYHTYRSSPSPKCSVDCGAQYISVSLDLIRSQAKFYDELLEKEILMPLGQKIENFRKLSETKTVFVAPGGTDSLVGHFLKKADCSVHLQHEVVEINLKEEEKVWEVKATNGTVRSFDVVILTIPVPEVLKLDGNFLSISQDDDDVKVSMEQVKYAPCIAVALIYDEPVKYLEELPTNMKYFPDDDIFHFMSVDNKKREQSKEVPGIILQSTTSFAEKCSNLNDDEIKKLMLEHIKCLMPEIPHPAFVKVFHWTYSMLTEPYVDTPGCVVIHDHPCLISGGESYTESTFNGCITSAVIVVEELLKRVKFVKGHRRRSS